MVLRRKNLTLFFYSLFTQQSIFDWKIFTFISFEVKYPEKKEKKKIWKMDLQFFTPFLFSPIHSQLKFYKLKKMHSNYSKNKERGKEFEKAKAIKIIYSITHSKSIKNIKFA